MTPRRSLDAKADAATAADEGDQTRAALGAVMPQPCNNDGVMPTFLPVDA